MQDAEVLRADILLDRLLNYLPQPIRPEDQRVVENMLRLGRPLRDGTLDATEFCQRFELLARNGAVAGREPVAPVSPSRSARDTRLQLREKVRLPSAWLACPRSWASRMLGRNRGRDPQAVSRRHLRRQPLQMARALRRTRLKGRQEMAEHNNSGPRHVAGCLH
ncbi:Smyd3 [Symbiodinium sp. CCMP2592]|nr:Smyd3 [Symbiodinium sp. CCMP2592]